MAQVAHIALFWAAMFGGGYVVGRWLRSRFEEEAFRFELFEAENRNAVDEVIKRKEQE